MSEFAGSDPKQFLNFETGRKEYGEIRDRLSELFNQMRPFAPEYADARMDPSAGLTRIIHAVQSHIASESL